MTLQEEQRNTNTSLPNRNVGKQKPDPSLLFLLNASIDLVLVYRFAKVSRDTRVREKKHHPDTLRTPGACCFA